MKKSKKFPKRDELFNNIILAHRSLDRKKNIFKAYVPSSYFEKNLYNYRNLTSTDLIIKDIEYFFSSRLLFLRALKEDANFIRIPFQKLLIYYSIENYRPQKAFKIIESISNHMKATRNKVNQPEPFNRVWRWLLINYSEYLLLNLDYISLEKFLIRFRDFIRTDFLEKYCIVLTVELKRNPNYKILSTIITSSSFSFNHTGKINDYFGSDEIIRLFSKNNDVIKLIENEVKLYNEKFPDWHLKSYIDNEPSGIIRLKYTFLDANSYSNEIFSSGKKLEYPKWHAFIKKGIPSMDNHGPLWTSKKNKWIRNGKFFEEICREVIVAIKNKIRDKMNIPRIGEGWVQERTLLYKIKEWYPQQRVIHQWSPSWLGRQRIDIGLPDVKLAIEYHGTQHFSPVDYFGGIEAYKNQIERDKKKKKLCAKNNIKLIVFTESDNEVQIKKTLDKFIVK